MHQVLQSILLRFFFNVTEKKSHWPLCNVVMLQVCQYVTGMSLCYRYVIMLQVCHYITGMVFATYILTLPCVFLAALTLVVFWLPPERPDRTALGKQQNY